MTDAILTVKDVRKSFGGVDAVAGVSLSLARGEIRALIVIVAPEGLAGLVTRRRPAPAERA